MVVIFGALLLIFEKPIAGMFGCSAEAVTLVQHIVGFLVWGYLFNAVTQCFMGRINGYGGVTDPWLSIRSENRGTGRKGAGGVIGCTNCLCDLL